MCQNIWTKWTLWRTNEQFVFSFPYLNNAPLRRKNAYHQELKRLQAASGVANALPLSSSDENWMQTIAEMNGKGRKLQPVQTHAQIVVQPVESGQITRKRMHIIHDKTTFANVIVNDLIKQNNINR